MKKFFFWLKYALLAFMAFVLVLFTIAYLQKDELLKRLNDQLEKDLHGELHIAKLDFTIFHRFPDFSFTLQGVSIRDTVFHQSVFSAEKIYLDIGLYELLKKEITIRSLTLENARLLLFKTRSGNTNLDLFKATADSVTQEKKTPYLLSFSKFELRNTEFIYADSSTRKFTQINFLKTKHTLHAEDSVYRMNTKGSIYFYGLFQNDSTGGYLVNKSAQANLAIFFDPSFEKIRIEESYLELEKTKLLIAGNLETKKGGGYHLHFQTDKIELPEGVTLLNKKNQLTLSRFIIDKPLDVEVFLSGNLIAGNEPGVDIRFNCKDTDFRYDKLNFKRLAFSGSFTQSARMALDTAVRDGQVSITSFNGSIEEVPFEGKVSFTQLKDPVMDLAMSSEIDFQKLNELVNTNEFQATAGTFSTHIQYKGKVEEYLDQTRTKYDGHLNGTMKATNAALTYKPKNLQFDKVNAEFAFTEKQFDINKLSLLLNGSALELKGSMKNFIPFFIRPKNKGYVTLTVNSPHLELTSLASKRSVLKNSGKQIRDKRKKMTGVLEMIYNKLEFDVRAKAKTFIYKKFTARNLSGRIKLGNNKLTGEGITMKVAGGVMDCDVTFTDINKALTPMNVAANVNGADIKEFFRCFNNFNQKTVTADHLSGKIYALTKFNATINSDYNVMPPSMKGTITCKISEGRLKDFEPLQNLSNFLFRKRDFSDVTFAELNSLFTIEGTALKISKMEIQSSVLSMFVQGRYSFTDSTSLSLQLPLSNLKKRDKNYRPENIGVDKKAGTSIFLHIYRNKDINSKLTIAYDPFKKWVGK